MDYITYPSGFVGSGEVDLGTVEQAQVDLAMSVGLFRQRISDAKSEPYCIVTESLYKKYFGKSMDMPALTELMRIAYKHIGDSPMAWLKRHNETQYKKSGNINRYNVEFICETFSYTFGSESRKMAMPSWRRFIYSGSTDDSIGTSSVYKRTLSDSYLPKRKTIDLLANWISTPAGQQDLLESLKLMYGSVLS
jgi:hypothetical protein